MRSKLKYSPYATYMLINPDRSTPATTSITYIQNQYTHTTQIHPILTSNDSSLDILTQFR